MNTQEIWKPISGYEGRYEISSLGRVKSHLGLKERILKPRKHNQGYICMHLKNHGRCSDYLAHRIVAQHFLPNPNNLKQVNHKNGNKVDNRVENLEWCTNRQNVIHRYRMEGKQYPTGVTKVSNGFRATIVVGTFQTPEQAHEAYMNAWGAIKNR